MEVKILKKLCIHLEFVNSVRVISKDSFEIKDKHANIIREIDGRIIISGDFSNEINSMELKNIHGLLKLSTEEIEIEASGVIIVYENIVSIAI